MTECLWDRNLVNDMSRMSIPRSIVNQILRQSQAQEEREVCGLLGGKDGMLTTCYPISNVANTPENLFMLDPRQQIDAMRHMRERGEELAAIYHSHPHSPARPSATDLAQAAYPEAIYLIVSLDTKGVLEMRAFHLGDHQVEDVELEMA